MSVAHRQGALRKGAPGRCGQFDLPTVENLPKALRAFGLTVSRTATYSPPQMSNAGDWGRLGSDWEELQDKDVRREASILRFSASRKRG